MNAPATDGKAIVYQEDGVWFADVHWRSGSLTEKWCCPNGFETKADVISALTRILADRYGFPIFIRETGETIEPVVEDDRQKTLDDALVAVRMAQMYMRKAQDDLKAQDYHIERAEKRLLMLGAVPPGEVS